MADEVLADLAAVTVPEGEHTINAAAEDGLLVGTDGDRFHETVGTGENALQLGGGEIPKFDAAIHAAAGEGSAVGGEGDRRDPIRMPDKGVAQLPGGNVPEFDRFIEAAADQGLAVGADRESGDGLAVGLDAEEVTKQGPGIERSQRQQNFHIPPLLFEGVCDRHRPVLQQLISCPLDTGTVILQGIEHESHAAIALLHRFN